MFSGFMVNAWTAGTLVAVVAGLVGFFVVLRGSAFVAHAIPNGSFAGAAGANLIGVGNLVGLGAFALLSAIGVGVLGRRGRHDVSVALVLVLMLGLGSLFLSFSTQYAPAVYSLLFGEVLGVSGNAIAPVAAMAATCVAAVALLWRPLMLSSLSPEMGEARGVSPMAAEAAFLLVVALATTTAVPVVGTLLVFSLMIGPPAAARSLSNSPLAAMVVSVALALATMWVALAASYVTDWPVGFFVATLGAAGYTLARILPGPRRAAEPR